MRFVWAVAAFVLAAVLIGAGVAQRTLFHGPATQSASIPVGDDTAFTMVDGAVLGVLPGSQTLEVSGPDGVFVAYGRTADVSAWLSDQPYTEVTVAEDGLIVSGLVEPEAPADGEDEAAAPPGRDPAGSDLWLSEYVDPAAVTTQLQLPETMSLVVASDGTAPAPDDITVTWDISQSTPWAGPLIVLGGIALLAGLVLYVLGLLHVRRSRGPRRKGPPPLPPTEPIDLAVTGASADGTTSAPPARKRLGRGRRALWAAPAVLASSALLAGCSPEAWPQLSPSPTPSPTATIVDSEQQQPPAVTEAQAQTILTRIGETVAQADAAADADLAATRLTGAALAERTTNYTLRDSIEDYPALSAVPAEPTQVILPQATDGWPRTMLAVVQNESAESTTSTIMMVTQEDPWAQYKLTYVGNLSGSTEMPDLAPTYIGARQVPPNSSFLAISPEELPAAYADVLQNGAESSYAGLFDEESDRFSESIASDREARLEQFNTTAAETGTLEFGSSPGDETPLALSTLESGAIVAVTVHETDTVTPANEDVVIRLEENPTVQALTGVEESETGVTTTFVDQLFFYVPAQGSTERIRLLGYSSNILDSEVL